MSDEEKEAIELLKTIDTIDLRETEQDLEEDFNKAIDIVLNLLSKKDKAIQETIKYLETYPYVAYTLNGDILHNSENAIKILKGEEIDEHLEGDIW